MPALSRIDVPEFGVAVAVDLTLGQEEPLNLNNVSGLQHLSIAVSSRSRPESLEIPAHLRSLIVVGSAEIDDRFIQRLTNLERLELHARAKNPLDLSPLINLKRLRIRWRPGLVGLGRLSLLEALTISSIPDKQSKGICLGLSSLNALQIFDSKVESIGSLGIEGALEKLALAYDPRLERLSDWDGLKQLKVLSIKSCKRLRISKEVRGLPALTHLYVEDQGKVDSLEFISSCPALRSVQIVGNTTVEDGRVREYVERGRFRYFRLQRRMHYDVTDDQINEIVRDHGSGKSDA